MTTVKVSGLTNRIRANQMVKGDYAIIADPDHPNYHGLVVVATFGGIVSLDGTSTWGKDCLLLVEPIGHGRTITITV